MKSDRLFDRTVSSISRLGARHSWLRVPAGLLVLLLQRTPVERVALPAETLIATPVGEALRSLLALGALGAYNSVAGATSSSSSSGTSTGTTSGGTTTSTTNYAVSNASPSTGTDGTLFTVNASVGAPITVATTESGSLTTPKSWAVAGTLPDGLSVQGGNPVNVSSPGKLVITGTPTVAGNWTVTLTCYSGTNETGYSSSIYITFKVTSTTATAPAITTQPVSQTGIVGGAVQFTAAASGNPIPTYQWYHDSVVVVGQTSNALTLTSLTTADAGNYTFKATNTAGSATSSAATLSLVTVAIAPTISTQPVSASAALGGSVTFSATVSGTAPLTYQWVKDNAYIAGATTNSYTVSSVGATDAGSYVLLVSNSEGTVSSATATLTVTNAAPVITTQPVSTTAVVGSTTSFSVISSGTPTLAYQWSKDGAAISGATASTYSIPVVSTASAGSYTVLVGNGYGSLTSTAAVLTVSAAQVAPSITTQPQSTSVVVGGSATLTVAASGSATLSYQWYQGSTAITGATGSSYTIASAQGTDAGSYSVVVSNSYGSATSSAATLTVTSSSSGSTTPAFTVQPASDTVAVAHGISFSATVSSATAVAYQWQVSTDGGTTWTSVSNNSTYSGATTGTLTVTNATAAMSSYQYRVVATNVSGSSTSSSLTLTVSIPPISGPYGIAADSSGNLFVSDSSTNLISYVTSGGQVEVLAGTAGQQGAVDGTYAAARFRQPHGVALDASKNLYVADTANSLIRKVSTAGVASTLAGSTTTQGYVDGTGTAAAFNAPQAVTVDSSGTVFVADTGNSAIRKVTSGGVVSTMAGTGQAGGTDGTAYQASFNHPAGIAVDSSGNLYVADTYNNTIRYVLGSTGVTTTVAGTSGVAGYADGTGTSALFNQPTGLVLDASGNLYVADTGNETIRVISKAGIVRTLAGLPTIAGLLDGAKTDAWFNQPENLALDGSGNVYVADFANASLRKVTSAGVVTTLTLTSSSATPSISGSSGTTTTTTSTTTSTGTTASSGGGGGGAIEPPFAAALLALAALRWRRRNRAG